MILKGLTYLKDNGKKKKLKQKLNESIKENLPKKINYLNIIRD